MYKVNLESYEINKNLSKGVPIGTPSGKNIVLLLDENSNPLPPGIIGEIYIGGPGVTDGYINDEDLTKKSFSIIKVNNNKINSYKTGDLAIYNSQNDLVFMGRKDSQVKIRGNRVGLIEIENALNISPHVLDCVVTYSQKLIAYLVLDQDLRYIRTQINRYLREELPNYMIPDLLIQIPNIPKNSNGKIDRKQLLKYNIEVDNVKYQKIANNDTEQRILECWEKVLGKGSVKSVDDNFFEIGGHSLNAYKLQNELEHEFKRKFNILEMFSYVTIRTFSNQLIRKKSNQISIDNRKLNKKKQITLLKKRRRQ
jgi:acyl carrier protein